MTDHTIITAHGSERYTMHPARSLFSIRLACFAGTVDPKAQNTGLALAPRKAGMYTYQVSRAYKYRGMWETPTMDAALLVLFSHIRRDRINMTRRTCRSTHAP